MGPRTFGVEEEFLLVDPDTGRPRAIAADMLAHPAGQPDPGFESELHLQQIEIATEPCRSLSEAVDDLVLARARASAAAREHGAELVALGTSPLPVDPEVFPGRRYRRIAERFGLTAQEQLTCGTHIHVSITSEDEGVAVLDRIRPWLAILLALSANSPFWQGEPTSYASYRAQVWARWPSAGPTELFGSPRAYHHTVQALIDTDTIVDEGMIYFDARLARSYPTVELRVPDVCLRAHDAALLGVLARALVDTAAREWANDGAVSGPRVELLKLANWRGSRSGLDDTLIHPHTGRPEPAPVVVHALVDHLRPSLEQTGEADDVEHLLEELLSRGNGACLQRAAHRRRGRLTDIVSDAIGHTLAR